MKDWQRKAIERGRTPLPDSPGDRPSLVPQTNLPASAPTAAASSSTGPGTSSSASTLGPAPQSLGQTPAPATQNDNQSYRFWPESELRRLIQMRNGGAEWQTIFGAFPDRTPEALKQTYHKRRHAMERRMAEETAAEEAASCAAGPSTETEGEKKSDKGGKDTT